MPECTFCGNEIEKDGCICNKIMPESAFGFFSLHTINKKTPQIKEVLKYVKDIEQQSQKTNSVIKTELFDIKLEKCHWCGYAKNKCICKELTKNEAGLFNMLYNYIKYDKLPEEAICQS
ncbi:MAG: hypothetical protein GY756_21400 [bacterium]|nr:hypothetical protein [bacterium]